MKIRYPEYYKNFHCIAGACPDTCCAGWEIPVDRKSEERYRNVRKSGKIKNKEFAKKLKKHIRNGRILSEEVTCPFLNEDGLCDMYIQLGPEALCHTCARHPRHMEDYGNLHEIVLLLSCPEVARLVLTENGDAFYTRNLPERRGNMDGIDEELLELLLESRELIWKIIKCGKIPMEWRMALVTALSHDLQRRMQTDDEPGIRQVLKRYSAEDAAPRFSAQWQIKSQNSTGDKRFLLMSDFMEEFASLDTICQDFQDRLEDVRIKLYHSTDSRPKYKKRRQEQLENFEETSHLFTYFIYSFFLASLYDGDVLTKVKMAVLCTMAIEEIFMAVGNPDQEEKIAICHGLARQIENSDDNRKKLEKFLKTEEFSARRIIDSLMQQD